jgi:hypothetical protein
VGAQRAPCAYNNEEDDMSEANIIRTIPVMEYVVHDRQGRIVAMCVQQTDADIIARVKGYGWRHVARPRIDVVVSPKPEGAPV